ncbi:MAG: TatD family hydrolase, partial [Gammaproteobacteria bacterium]
MLIDSHCHLNCLDLTAYDNDLSQVLAAAKANNVGFMLCVCIDLDNYPDVLAIAKAHPNIAASVGVHPNVVLEQEVAVETLVKLAEDENVVAIGETGLDYYRSQGDLSWQQQRFCNHMEVAKQVDKPLIIHSRAAREDTLALMREHNAEQIGGVMHCFTETWEMAKQCLDLGFYISFSGIVTFKNAQDLQQVAKKVPLDRLLVETDSPYLAPEPYRGKSNQP